MRRAHGLLRSRYRVSRVSSCATRPCCLLGTVVSQGDYRRTCRTSDARRATLPALWAGHSGDSGEVHVTVERRASLSVGQRASGRREVHMPILPRPLGRGGEGCGPSAEVSLAELRLTASIRTEVGPSRSSGREWLTQETEYQVWKVPTRRQATRQYPLFTLYCA